MTKETVGPRVAAIVGSYTSGKTTLFEDMLFAAGAIPRRGSVKDGNTVGDTSPQSRERGMSTELNVASFSYLDDAWALIDCPGSVELTHEAEGAMMVADLVIVVAEPSPDRAITLSPILRFLDDRSIPHLVYINKMDQAEASVRATFEGLQAVSSRPLVLREIPMRDEAGQITGMVDLVSERAWRWNPGKPSDLIALPDRLAADEGAARSTMLESLADFDDALMGELLEDTVPSTDEIYENLTRDLAADLIVPVFFGSAENQNGINRLLKALRHEAPGVAATRDRLGLGDKGTQAQVFKTLYAGQSGKLSLVRVWSGEVRDGMTLGQDRVGGLSAPMGRKLTPKASATAGEVAVLGRMAHAATGDLLTETGVAEADWPAPPPALHALAIAASQPSDDVRLAAALTRLAEEDPSLRFAHHAETGQLVLSGQGEVQLQIALARLKSDAGLAVTASPPAIPYRETITKPATIAARHKKQSGGHGEFADVTLEIRPQPRGAGFAFDDRITGGVVPKAYIPAVHRGVEAWLAKGPMGCPIVDVAVTLTDGSYHNVDSSDMAFQKAAAKAMSEAMPGCGPVLLEPVRRVRIDTPAEFTARVQRIVTGRRGQLLGYDAKPGWPGWDRIEAMMPESDMAGMIVDIRSQTLGVGSFTSDFDHLQELHGKDADKARASLSGA
ncbi:elongation factor G [Paracoccus sp. p3-h83]|uniref:elongation factor G n=1 Tax=Paracoccus sp. p3-h83 TaxID=3342805 RepID=UPI0035B92725